MGIEEEKIEQIIEAHAETVDTLKEQRDTFKADADKLAEVQKELDEAKKSLEDAGKDSYKVKYEAVKEEFENIKEANKGTIILDGSACNASCAYCFINACKYEARKPSIDSQAIRGVLRETGDRTERVTIWAGEPLYNKEELLQIVDIVNSELPETKIELNTNGFLLSDWYWIQFRYNICKRGIFF